MNPFMLHMRTRIHFGAGVLAQAGAEAAPLAGDGPVMVLTGGGSVHRNGVFDQVATSLEAAGVPFFEQPGVQPNPRVDHIRDSISLCRDRGVELILAVGGGSCIDAAKAIAAGARYDGDVWELFTGAGRAPAALRVGAVLTLAATGSEFNGGCVVSDPASARKLPYLDEMLRPAFSLLDPATTLTLPPRQSAAGVVDIVSHILEQYFSPTVATVQDRLAEALLTVCRDQGPKTLDPGDDLQARADIMWASSLALCGLIGSGKDHDWATHMIEHELSAHYDLTHGVGLAILTPAWMTQVLDEETAPRLARFGCAMWGLDPAGGMATAREAIEWTREFFSGLGLASTLAEEGIDDARFEQMATDVTARGPIGGFKKLDRDDVLDILDRCR